LTPEQLGKIEELNKENKYSSIAIFKEENKVVIEVDVEEITKKIKSASENKGKSPEEIKGLVLKGIYNEVDRNLKGLAGVIGGELERHTDRKLLHGIAEKLYREYDGQNKSAEAAKSSEQSSEAAVPNKSSSTMKSSETVKNEEFNMTNPNQFPFPFGKGNMSTTESRQLLQDIKKKAEGLEGAFNFKDVPPSEEIKQLSTSTVKRDKEGGGRSV